MKPSLSYEAQEVYTHDRDRFYQSLFVPASCREAFFCLYALNLELARIPAMVSEEMIGHIRYAWWQEAVEEMAAGGKAKGQPLLQTLAPMIKDGRMPPALVIQLITAYREHYPASLPDLDALLGAISLELLQTVCPQAERPWRKAQALIARHRQRHGDRCQGWLACKLLICSF